MVHHDAEHSGFREIFAIRADDSGVWASGTASGLGWVAHFGHDLALQGEDIFDPGLDDRVQGFALTQGGPGQSVCAFFRVEDTTYLGNLYHRCYGANASFDAMDTFEAPGFSVWFAAASEDGAIALAGARELDGWVEGRAGLHEVHWTEVIDSPSSSDLDTIVGLGIVGDEDVVAIMRYRDEAEVDRMQVMRFSTTGALVWSTLLEHDVAALSVSSGNLVLVYGNDRDAGTRNTLLTGVDSEDGTVLWTREFEHVGQVTNAAGIASAPDGSVVLSARIDPGPLWVAKVAP